MIFIFSFPCPPSVSSQTDASFFSRKKEGLSRQVTPKMSTWKNRSQTAWSGIEVRCPISICHFLSPPSIGDRSQKVGHIWEKPRSRNQKERAGKNWRPIMTSQNITRVSCLRNSIQCGVCVFYLLLVETEAILAQVLCFDGIWYGSPWCISLSKSFFLCRCMQIFWGLRLPIIRKWSSHQVTPQP